jgi:Tfp pilus assembly protein PilN
MMLNLMPQDLKQGYGYARHNVMLRNWAAALFFSLIGLVVVATFGLLTMQASAKDYSNQVSQAQAQLQKEKLDETKKQVQDISGTLKLAVQVLGQEVLFSKLITQIGANMPTGSVLTALNINKVSGGLTLSATATNYTTATQVQVNLADPKNQIFSKVDIDNVSCTNQNKDSAYPCTVQLRALFNTNNPFLLINQGKKL